MKFEDWVGIDQRWEHQAIIGVAAGVRWEPNKIWCIPSVREKILGHEDGAPKRSSSTTTITTTTMLRSPARVVLQDSSASTSSTLSAPPTPVHHGAASSSTVSSRLSLLDTCHRKIRFFGELVAWVPPPSSSISSLDLYVYICIYKHIIYIYYIYINIYIYILYAYIVYTCTCTKMSSMKRALAWRWIASVISHLFMESSGRSSLNWG